MDTLKKKLTNLSDLLKQFNASIKMPKGPKPPRAPAGPAKPKIGIAPTNKKDPVKVAEQITNAAIKPMVMDAAKQTKEALKVSKLGQWNIVKSEDDRTKPITSPSIDSSTDVKPIIKDFNNTLNSKHEQRDLIDGIDFASKKNKLNTEQLEGESKDVGWLKNKQGKNVWVKSAAGHPDIKHRGHDIFNAAERETLFHNMAHDFFGLGKHVPTTSHFIKDGVPHSAQAEVEGGQHVSRPETKPSGLYELPKDYTDTINNLHNSGELHKIAIMDTLMGHHDRHRANFMYNPKQKDRLHLIDNGTAFDYKNFDMRDSPHYWDHAVSGLIKDLGRPDTIHPEAKKWLMDLSQDKAKKFFTDSGYMESDPHVRGFATRLQHMQEAVKNDKYNKMKELLKDNKYSTGPSWHNTTKFSRR